MSLRNVRCWNGQPRCTPLSPLGRIPGVFALGAVFQKAPPPNVPSGGFYPFSNSAPQAAAAPAAPGPAFRVTFQGSLDSSAFQTVPLAMPFDQFGAPVTQEISFTLSANYRLNSGGLGVTVRSQARNFGYDFQASVGPAPDQILLSIYSDYGTPVDPDSVNVTRTDYAADWPAGLDFTIRITIDAARIPHLYINGVETPLAGGVPSPYVLPNGNDASIYGYSTVPGNSVVVHNLVIRDGVIPPPAAV